MASEQRFTFRFDTAANVSGVTALTAAVKAQAAVQGQMGAAVKSTDAWVKSWNGSVTTAANGTRQWANESRKTIAELQALQRAQRATEINQSAANVREARLAMGAKWAGGKGGAAAGMAGAGAAAAGGAGGMNSGRALLEFSRAAEDAQYGVAGVLNNLPGLVAMLGGGAGLAGALSLAAVGATQLYKQLSSVPDAVDPKILEAKMAALNAVLEAGLNAMSQRLTARFEEDLKAAQTSAENALGQWQASLENGKAGAAKGDAGAAAQGAAQGAARAFDGALTPDASAAAKAQNEKAIKEREQAAADQAARDKLTREAEQAAQERQIAERQIAANRGVIDGVDARRGVFGQTQKDRQSGIIQDMRGKGVLSDQEQQVTQFDKLVSQREMKAKIAAENEAKDAGISWADTWANPKALRDKLQARSVAKRTRAEVDALNPQIDAISPGVEDARAAMQRGEVTFNADPSKLNGNQKLALTQGKVALDAEAAQRAQDAEIRAKAEADARRANDALEAAQAKEAAVRNQRQEFELNRTARQVQAGQLPDMPPEMAGRMLQEAQSRGAEQVPGALPLPTFEPPDLSAQTQAFDQAMGRTEQAVQGAMERLVGSSEKLANSVAAMQARTEARLSSMSAQIEALKTR